MTISELFERIAALPERKREALLGWLEALGEDDTQALHVLDDVAQRSLTIKEIWEELVRLYG